MTVPKSVARRCAIGVLLVLPFFLAAVIVAEAWLRFTTNLPFISRTHCFTQSAREAPGFLPGCRETIRTPAGPIEFRTNEDGFRDRPRAFFGGGAVAVMGDSYAEGFWVSEDQGISRVLEKELRGRYPLLNTAIRGTGPSQQAIRYYRAAEKYRIRGVLWFLNPSDPTDEKYFLARNPDFHLENGQWSPLAPLWPVTPAYWRWTNLSLRFSDRFYLPIYLAERWVKQDWQSELIRGIPFREEQHCRSLRRLAGELATAKVPLAFVATPHGYIGNHRYYLGLPVDDNEFDRLLACARGTGATVIDVRHELESTASWYFRNDWHLNPDGIRALARIAAPRILDAWPRDLR